MLVRRAACGGVKTIRASWAQNVIDSNCENSTVDDDWGPEFASRARSFLEELQHVVSSNDKARFSLLVQYPVTVFTGNHKSEIATPGDLMRRYKSIMTPGLKKVIITQSSKCLFANGQGVMVGRGNIWFQQQPGGQMKIITFNLDPPKSTTHAMNRLVGK